MSFSRAISRLARKKEPTIVSKSTSLRQFSKIVRRIVLIRIFVTLSLETRQCEGDLLEKAQPRGVGIQPCNYLPVSRM